MPWRMRARHSRACIYTHIYMLVLVLRSAVDMSILVCLVLLGGVWEPIVKWRTCVHHLHTFLHTGSGLYNPLQHPRCVSRPHILYNISTTLYSLQLYSISTVYNLYNTPLNRRQPWGTSSTLLPPSHPDSGSRPGSRAVRSIARYCRYQLVCNSGGQSTGGCRIRHVPPDPARRAPAYELTSSEGVSTHRVPTMKFKRYVRAASAIWGNLVERRRGLPDPACRIRLAGKKRRRTGLQTSRR